MSLSLGCISSHAHHGMVWFWCIHGSTTTRVDYACGCVSATYTCVVPLMLLVGGMAWFSCVCGVTMPELRLGLVPLSMCTGTPLWSLYLHNE